MPFEACPPAHPLTSEPPARLQQKRPKNRVDKQHSTKTKQNPKPPNPQTPPNPQDQLGYPQEALTSLEIAEPVPPLPRPAVPPYNGYGGLDDSRQNCVALVPKPPKKVGGARARGRAGAGKRAPGSVWAGLGVCVLGEARGGACAGRKRRG